MERKTALHLIQSLNRGGCETMILRLIPYLEKNNWRNIVITIGDEGELFRQFQIANIQVIALKQKFFLSLRTVFLLSRYIKEIKPDIITTYLLRADILGRIFLPFLTTKPIVSYLVTTYNHPRYRVARFFEWITQFFTSHYLANSEAVRKFYENSIGIKKGKIRVIPTGIDIALFQSASGENMKKELGIPQDSFVITCVANLDENKGQTYLLDAFEKTFAHNPSAFLFIVGQGPQENTLLAQKSTFLSKDRIFLFGMRSDIPEILAATNIFVLPTLFEGMSVALLEAMASSKTIITTDISENKVILSDHKSALLIPTKNTDKLSQALQATFDNPELSNVLAKAAFAHVSQHHSLEVTSKQLAETYLCLCQTRS